jgi:hypothetical protein
MEQEFVNYLRQSRQLQLYTTHELLRVFNTRPEIVYYIQRLVRELHYQYVLRRRYRRRLRC